MRFHKFSFILFLLATFLILPYWRTNTHAISQWDEFEHSNEYNYGEYIHFRGRFVSESPLKQADLFIQIEGESDTRSVSANISDQPEISYDLDLTHQPIRAYSTITYWYEITLQNGEVLISPEIPFSYEDNRFDWKTRDANMFGVHWYEGDTTFAQSLLDVSELGLQKIQGILPLVLEDRIDIYAYANAAEMRETLQVSGKNWVGAHTDPDLGVMVVSLPAVPEQRLEMERQIPHELMHIMLFQYLGTEYTNLPTWLNEGLASIAELYPNPDYLSLLNSAHTNQSLIPISSLCQAFPRDASSAYLAYAEATSFTRYLHQQYGTSGLEKLITAYSDGMSCERGVQSVFGNSLSQLEKEWRQEAFGEDFAITAVSNLLPWLVLLIVILGVPLLLILNGIRSTPTNQYVNTHSKK